jgi:hypothetical protein
VCEATSIGTEEFVDLSAYVGDALVRAVDRINYQNDLNGSLAAAEGLKGGDGPRDFVIQESEVLLLKTGNRGPGFRSDDDVKVDLTVARLG